MSDLTAQYMVSAWFIALSSYWQWMYMRQRKQSYDILDDWKKSTAEFAKCCDNWMNLCEQLCAVINPPKPKVEESKN